MDFWIKAAQLILSLSLLVVLHEFGHYLTARYFKIRVEKFYLFFNPWFSLFKKKIGETEWGIGWLPFGGYVKISGMIDESMDKEQMAQPAQPHEFRSKPAWQRLIVMIGGVVVNIITGVLIYIFVFFGWGEEQAPTADIKAGLSIHPYLEQYGLESGDNILKINGEDVVHFNDINNGLLLRDQRELTVKKKSGETKVVTLPEGIEYELFHTGALRPVSLRHRSVEIDNLITVGEVSSAGIRTSDYIVAIDHKPISAIDFSATDWIKAEKNSVGIIRGKDSIQVDLTKAEMEALLKEAPAMTAGIQPHDKVIQIGEQKVAYFDEIVSELYHNKSKSVDVTVLRGNDTVVCPVNVSEAGSIGFAPITSMPEDMSCVKTVHYGFGASISRGVAKGFTTLNDYVSQLKFLFTKKGATSIGGFGAIGGLFPSTWDWQIFWMNTALISIILAFMNILPIPALDGGHVVFLLYEMITGKEAPQKVLEYAQYVGFFLLMGLLLYANGNDIYRYFFGG